MYAADNSDTEEPMPEDHVTNRMIEAFTAAAKAATDAEANQIITNFVCKRGSPFGYGPKQSFEMVAKSVADYVLADREITQTGDFEAICTAIEKSEKNIGDVTAAKAAEMLRRAYKAAPASW